MTRRTKYLCLLLVLLCVLLLVLYCHHSHWMKAPLRLRITVPQNEMTALLERIQDTNKYVRSSTTKLSKNTLVLIYSYMRGGSSLMASIFEQHHGCLYYFEPGFSIYNALYGVPFGTHPEHLYFNRTGGVREIPGFERRFLATQLANLHDCNFKAVPIEVLAMGFTSMTSQHYAGCMLSRGATNRPIDVCQRDVPCGRWISPSDHCGTFFALSRIPNATKRRRLESQIKSSRHIRSTTRWGFPSSDEYLTCLELSKRSAKTCMEHLYKKCNKSQFTAMKILRIDLQAIELLLKNNDRAHLVYGVRDPRAIAVSRRKKGWMVFQNIETESASLCRRMLKDVQVIRRLNATYRGRVHLLRYEELVHQPLETISQIYATLGIGGIGGVLQYIKKALKSPDDVDVLHPTRHNGIQVYRDWEHHVTNETMAKLTNNCRDVVISLGYL